MKAGEFQKRFELAACFCRDFTRKHLTDYIPDSLRFVFTVTKLTDEKTLVINGCEYKTEELRSVTPVDALKYLYYEGLIPSWVDLYVDSYDDEHTYIALTFSTEFTDKEELLYKRNSKLPPFHVIGPTIPEGWESLGKDGPFDFISFT